jgi:hypothetical protein
MAELLPPDLEYRPLPAQMQVPPRSTTLSPESPFSAAQSVIDTPLLLGYFCHVLYHVINRRPSQEIPS